MQKNYTNAIKHTTKLKPKAKNKFMMETKSNFDYLGEFATFMFEKKAERATKVLFGASPSERL